MLKARHLPLSCGVGAEDASRGQRPDAIKNRLTITSIGGDTCQPVDAFRLAVPDLDINLIDVHTSNSANSGTAANSDRVRCIL